ncbi:MAG: histidine kinase [Gemmatimonadota bacterium]|nr:histidine kinase [Gemmatimonadota bacterium]
MKTVPPKLPSTRTLLRTFLPYYASAWGLLLIVYAALLYSSVQLPLIIAVYAATLGMAPAAVCGLLIWRVCHAITWPSSRRARSVAAFFASHAVGAVIYAAVWTTPSVIQVFMYASRAEFRSYVATSVGWQLLLGAVLYAGIAGVAYAVQLSQRLREQEALAVRAELNALRAQLDPHFLFNTLHSITALVHSDPGAVEGVLERLASLLRYVLRDHRPPHDDVPLESELEFVRSYLALEQMRFGDRLLVTEDVDPDTLECLVPALTLQPLVENAIRHGLAPLLKGGTLHLSAQLDNETLMLTIADDGRGANKAAVEASSGFGLSAVKRRLAVRHPGHVVTQIRTAPDQGFTVTLRLPARAGVGTMLSRKDTNHDDRLAAVSPSGTALVGSGE